MISLISSCPQLKYQMRPELSNQIIGSLRGWANNIGDYKRLEMRGFQFERTIIGW